MSLRDLSRPQFSLLFALFPYSPLSLKGGVRNAALRGAQRAEGSSFPRRSPQIGKRGPYFCALEGLPVFGDDTTCNASLVALSK